MFNPIAIATDAGSALLLGGMFNKVLSGVFNPTQQMVSNYNATQGLIQAGNAARQGANSSDDVARGTSQADDIADGVGKGEWSWNFC